MITSRDLGGSIVYTDIYIYNIWFFCVWCPFLSLYAPKTFHLSGVELNVTFMHEQVGYLYLPLSVIMSYYVFNRAKAQQIEDGMCKELDAEHLTVSNVKFPGDVICICSRQPGGLRVPPVANGGTTNWFAMFPCHPTSSVEWHKPLGLGSMTNDPGKKSKKNWLHPEETNHNNSMISPYRESAFFRHLMGFA